MNLENKILLISENILHFNTGKIVLKNIDDFEALYSGVKSLRSDHFDAVEQTGYFENFGNDELKVEGHIKKNGIFNIWTEIDIGIGLLLVAGYYPIESFRYFISNEKWSNCNEVFLIESPADEGGLIN